MIMVIPKTISKSHHDHGDYLKADELFYFENVIDIYYLDF